MLQADRHQITRHQRIAEAIHRAIPYPVLLLLACESRVAISMANKRFSQSDGNKIIAEELYSTDWLNPDAATGVHKDFPADMAIGNLPQTNFNALYNGWLERIISLQCARFSGQYWRGTPGTDWQIRRDQLAKCQQIEQNIAELRRELKAETQFNRQVELNLRIKAAQKELTLTAGKL